MFSHTQLLISTLLATSCVLGAPSTLRRAADPCDGLGAGAYSNITQFRVAASHGGRNEHPYGPELVQGMTGGSHGVTSTTFTVSAVRPHRLDTGY